LLKAAKFQVQHHRDPGEKTSFLDLVATREHLGIIKRYAIEVVLVKENIDLSPHIDRLENYSIHRKRVNEFDEIWLVSNLSVPEEAQRQYPFDRVRSFTLKELEALLARLTPSPPQPSRGRTRIGKAVFANEQQLQIAIAALSLLFDEKIAALKDYVPNDPDSVARKDASLQQYEKLRAELNAVSASIAQFNKGDAKEPQIVKSITTFADGVRSWWNKSHETICTKTYDMGLFASAVGVCSLAGAGGKMSVAVSAALVGGKPVADALKGIAKRFIT
jgi:hypothetical protein